MKKLFISILVLLPALTMQAQTVLTPQQQLEKAQKDLEEAKKALEATTAAIKDALVAGDKVALIGFGTFSVNERPAREGINPATKEKIQIAAKKVAKFKAGAELSDALNK